MLFLGCNALFTWVGMHWGFAWYGYGYFMAALVTFLILFFLGFLVAFYTHIMEDGVANRTVLTSTLAAVFAGLVALDIYLFSNRESFLG